MIFLISEIPLENSDLKSDLLDNKAGGFVCFEGWVRDFNENKEVLMLEYEAYPAMAKSEAEKIFLEAKEKFNLLDVKCIHRVGKLKVGEIAVWLAVTSVHRDPAFGACQYIIDNIKARLPIWKKEYYKDGDSGWVNCDECAKHIDKTKV